uniref:Uncharacterized protein n=1 Tax=Arundo donax TaxID=35708 RepID=A0A0A9EFK1_ARUDO
MYPIAGGPFPIPSSCIGCAAAPSSQCCPKEACLFSSSSAHSNGFIDAFIFFSAYFSAFLLVSNCSILSSITLSMMLSDSTCSSVTLSDPSASWSS